MTSAIVGRSLAGHGEVIMVKTVFVLSIIRLSNLAAVRMAGRMKRHMVRTNRPVCRPLDGCDV